MKKNGIDYCYQNLMSSNQEGKKIMSLNNHLKAGLTAGVALLGLGIGSAFARDSNPGNVARFVTFLGNDSSLDNRNLVKKGDDYVGLPCDYLVKAFQTTENGLTTTKYGITHRPDTIKNVVQYQGQGSTSYGSADIVNATDTFANKNFANISVAALIADGVTPSDVEQMITQFQGAVCPTLSGSSTPDPDGDVPPPPPPPPPIGCCSSAAKHVQRGLEELGLRVDVAFTAPAFKVPSIG